MKQTYADGIAVLVLGVVLLTGGIATWQAYQQWAALGEMGGHMGDAAAAIHGTHPVWYLLGTILIAGVLSGVYVSVRDRLVSSGRSEKDPDTAAVGEATRTATDTDSAGSVSGDESYRHVLDVLLEDERRILDPVLDSPGLTQIELRDRSEFSKSKVSQTATDLEKRGLLYREPQGRTYRVYPADELQREDDESVSTN